MRPAIAKRRCTPGVEDSKSRKIRKKDIDFNKSNHVLLLFVRPLCLRYKREVENVKTHLVEAFSGGDHLIEAFPRFFRGGVDELLHLNSNKNNLILRFYSPRHICLLSEKKKSTQ